MRTSLTSTLAASKGSNGIFFFAASVAKRAWSDFARAIIISFIFAPDIVVSFTMWPSSSKSLTREGRLDSCGSIERFAWACLISLPTNLALG